jgi:hypothetical protein
MEMEVEVEVEVEVEMGAGPGWTFRHCGGGIRGGRGGGRSGEDFVPMPSLKKWLMGNVTGRFAGMGKVVGHLARIRQVVGWRPRGPLKKCSLGF